MLSPQWTEEPHRRLVVSPEAVGLDCAKVEQLFERAEQEVREGLLPSVQIAIARRGRIAAMRTFGSVTHGGQTVAATNDTLYAVFSATKAIISAAAWLLMQDGMLGTQERVADIIPEFGTHGKDIVRVEQLFTHTAGFPYAPFMPTDWLDRHRRLERFQQWRLNWDPGTRFEYHATSSMWVVAELIERRSGLDFRDFIRTRVADVLGLPDLHVGLPPALHGRVANVVHVSTEPTAQELAAVGFPIIPRGEVTEQALEGLNQPAVREVGIPGGGGIMTAGDLALFYQALLAGRGPGSVSDFAVRSDPTGSGPAELTPAAGPGGTPVWKPETLSAVRKVRTGDLTDPVFKKRANRGLGLVIAGDADRVFRGFGHTGSARMFGHNGAGGQIAWADPETGISFAYCTNGLDRHPMRQARRTVALSSLAAICAD